MMTKEVLENALAEFGGTIILVSHDRYLLNKVAGRIIEIKPDEVNSYEGDFDAYAEAVTQAVLDTWEEFHVDLDDVANLD
jgi:ATP-binding cassette subfamily F protein 3